MDQPSISPMTAQGQFTYDFDGEQLFSVDLKRLCGVCLNLPNFAYFDPQSGLVSIAMIKAHLEVLVERSNGTRAPKRYRALPLPTPQFRQQGGPEKPSAPPLRPLLAPWPHSQNLRLLFSTPFFPGGSESPQIPSTAPSYRNDPSCLANLASWAPCPFILLSFCSPLLPQCHQPRASTALRRLIPGSSPPIHP